LLDLAKALTLPCVLTVDKAMQEEQERRRQANQVLRKQEEVMEREREAKNAETERVREELAAAQTAHQTLRDQLNTLVEEKTYSEQKTIEQARLVADLENRLRLREAELKRQLEEQKHLFAGMKQELHEKEADLNTQVVERESIIREVRWLGCCVGGCVCVCVCKLQHPLTHPPLALAHSQSISWG
jgi:hypothetical protein